MAPRSEELDKIGPIANLDNVMNTELLQKKKIGRPLARGEIVHHINGNKFDNRPENLEVMAQSDHIKHHLPKMLEARKMPLKVVLNHTNTTLSTTFLIMNVV